MRVFIALPVSGNFLQAIAVACEPLRLIHPGLRWAKPEGMHLTLAFMGEIEEARLEAVVQATRAAIGTAAEGGVRGPLTLEPGRLLTFPPRGRASVIAVSIGRGSAEATALAAALEDALDRAGAESGLPFRPREKRPFTPHITLARAGRPGIALSPADRAAHISASCTVGSVVVYRSVTGPGGARYEALETLPLG